jgi:hypothetical protein
VLIHGAAGGVGGFAVQLARARGAHVIGTASAANLGSVRELGAHEAVDAATRFEDAWNPSTSCSTPPAASGCAGPAPCCAPAGDWSRWPRSRPMEACTSSSSRIATSSGRSRGWPMTASCGPARRGLPAHVGARGVRAQPGAGPTRQGRVGRVGLTAAGRRPDSGYTGGRRAFVGRSPARPAA